MLIRGWRPEKHIFMHYALTYIMRCAYLHLTGATHEPPVPEMETPP